MAVVLRLTRAGRRKAIFYRIVVADRRSPRDGRFIEQIGSYDPLKETPAALRIDVARVEHWLSVGAQASQRVGELIRAAKHNAPQP
jgi:small subunit ribosomal protein S16